MTVDAPPNATDCAGLLAEIAACRRCRDAPLIRPLPHEPRPVLRISATARILVAGQAPGTRVHASGIPFTDPSGDRLREWMGVTPDEFYNTSTIAIVPMGFCFPGLDTAGSDLPPRRECAPMWRPRVMAALANVELVLAIGGHAIGWHAPQLSKRPVGETVARWRDVVDATTSTGLTVIPLPHPSWRNSGWLNRNPWFADDVLPELRGRVRQLINQSSAQPPTAADRREPSAGGQHRSAIAPS